MIVTSANLAAKASTSRSLDWPVAPVLCHCRSWQFPEPGFACPSREAEPHKYASLDQSACQVPARGPSGPCPALLTSRGIQRTEEWLAGTVWTYLPWLLILWGHVWVTENLEQSVRVTELKLYKTMGQCCRHPPLYLPKDRSIVENHRLTRLLMSEPSQGPFSLTPIPMALLDPPTRF